MGKIIILTFIILLIIWIIDYIITNNKNKKVNNVDTIAKLYQDKINEIESKSIEEIKKQEDLLNFYKSELEKINLIKTKNK